MKFQALKYKQFLGLSGKSSGLTLLSIRLKKTKPKGAGKSQSNQLPRFTCPGTENRDHALTSALRIQGSLISRPSVGEAPNKIY